MKSNYQPIGKYIREVSVRNNDLRTTNLLGINIDKYFMPSVANIVGTDLSVYKIVKKWQFACNRMHVGRDGRLPIALSTYDDEFIVSPAYNVFEIIDESILSPEYLMMWFTRSEFDRNACFYTDADVRAGLSWEAFSGMKLPVPHIDKQREIVQEYKTITDRIELNKKLCLKLEETAQAVYREWFVDFEFPNEDGKPYKSSGGEMMESELGEIPLGWRVGKISELGSIKHGYAFKGEDFTEEETELVLVSPGNFKIQGGFNFEKNKYYQGNYPKSYILDENDVVVNMTDLSKNGDTLGNTAVIPELQFKILLHNQRVGKFELIDKIYSFYIYFSTNQIGYKHYILGTATGTTVRHTSPDRIGNYQFLIPNNSLIVKFHNVINPFIKLINLSPTEQYQLYMFKNILLSKLAQIGVE